MDLRCKVFRGPDASALEEEINRFLAQELAEDSAVQLEEITQSEGPTGVTITLWYSKLALDAELVDEYEGEHPTGELS